MVAIPTPSPSPDVTLADGSDVPLGGKIGYAIVAIIGIIGLVWCFGE
jgi:hypothetical protein